MSNREKALAEARLWLSTSYRHGASSRDVSDDGYGADFFGLLRGIWRAVYDGTELETYEYKPDWAAPGEEDLLAVLDRNMIRIPIARAQPGDVIVFRMAPDAPARHLAILSAVPTVAGGRVGRVTPKSPPQPAEGRIIHAYWGRAVVESWMGPWWKAREVDTAFTWPSEAQS